MASCIAFIMMASHHLARAGMCMPDAFELDSRPLAFNQDLTGDHSMPVKIKF